MASRSIAKVMRSIIILAPSYGDIGSNAQHAFYQLLHQGTQAVSCDFIAPIRRYAEVQQANSNLIEQHQLSLY